MRRRRLLDLFCGAGGAAVGYHRAGFDVVGVDIEPQPRYPFEFHQADAMTFPLDGFDVIHASPPCQAYTDLRRARAASTALIEPVRERSRFGVPYVIENVEGAPLLDPIVLCGTMFPGLRVLPSSAVRVQHAADRAAARAAPADFTHDKRKAHYGSSTRTRPRAGHRRRQLHGRQQARGDGHPG